MLSGTDRQRIAEITEREKAATPGPWKADDGGGYDIFTSITDGAYDIAGISGDDMDADAALEHRENARFIAHARDDIPWLLAKIAELEASQVVQRPDHRELIAEVELARETIVSLEHRLQAVAADEYHRGYHAGYDAILNQKPFCVECDDVCIHTGKSDDRSE